MPSRIQPPSPALNPVYAVFVPHSSQPSQSSSSAENVSTANDQRHYVNDDNYTILSYSEEIEDFTESEPEPEIERERSSQREGIAVQTVQTNGSDIFIERTMMSAVSTNTPSFTPEGVEYICGPQNGSVPLLLPVSLAAMPLGGDVELHHCGKN